MKEPSSTSGRRKGKRRPLRVLAVVVAMMAILAGLSAVMPDEPQQAVQLETSSTDTNFDARLSASGAADRLGRCKEDCPQPKVQSTPSQPAASPTPVAQPTKKPQPPTPQPSKAPPKKKVVKAKSGGSGGTVPESCIKYSGNRRLGCKMTLERGFKINQFSCLEKLWTKESGWNPKAKNRSSGAYGIPQSLPGNKMASAGSDWLSNPATQIKWGLGYIKGRYGTPCAAWNHSQRKGWY